MACVTTRAHKGFTLIELLAALAVMALMAVLSWRGLDGISRTQQRLQGHADEVLALQATLAQWASDLDALEVQPNAQSLDWDGRALRLLRRSRTESERGLVVVAWAQQLVDGKNQWVRWQSTALPSRAALELAWLKAAQWGQNPTVEDKQRQVATVAIDQWQIFYFRGNAWTNPLSSAGGAAVGGAKPLTPTSLAAQGDVPDGVRLVLTLTPGQALSGTITRDWARPVLGGSP